MRSQAQIEASRRNGAKSRGPITPEGKAISSRNALRHGNTAQSVLLTSEDHAAFNQLADAFYHRFQPADDVEREIVNEMIVALWHRRRDRSALAALLDHEMDHQTETVDSKYTPIDHATRYALALRALADQSRSLHLMNRYENTHRLTFHRSLGALRTIKNYETNPEDSEPIDPVELETQETNPPNPSQPEPPGPIDAAPNPSGDHASQPATNNDELTTR